MQQGFHLSDELGVVHFHVASWKKKKVQKSFPFQIKLKKALTKNWGLQISYNLLVIAKL